MENTVTERYKTLIKQACPMCNEITYMKVTEDENKQIKNYWTYGGLIQKKLSLLDKFGREFIKSGYCPECQKTLFSNIVNSQERYFTQKSLRADVMINFIEKVSENKLRSCEAIQSKFANELNSNEKFLFLYETGLDDLLYLDEKGNVKEC